MPGATLTHPRYIPLGVLGRGAQGLVLSVQDRESPERKLVAKLWTRRLEDVAEARAEFALLARIRAPGLVHAHDFALDLRTGAPFFVEDRIDGPDARAFVAAAEIGAANGRLGQILASVLATLGCLHDAGFVHGDLKPAHVRVEDPEGAPRVILLDLGSSLAQGSAHTRGFTPRYAAPELLAGASSSIATDLYGLGALAFASATGLAPEAGASASNLRERAPWVEPKIADLVAQLLSHHPGDRPGTSVEALASLGRAAARIALRSAPHAPPPLGRERELEALGTARGVHYVTGPSGAGKSHLVRELTIRALLEGRDARLLTFPGSGDTLVPRLVAWLRGDGPPPFVARGDDGGAPLLVVLDGLERAPAELGASVDAWRCATPDARSAAIVASTRTAPRGAPCTHLGPLPPEAFEALATSLGLGIAERREASRSAGGNPGWLVAAAGRVPLELATAQARLADVSEAARDALALVALVGGSAPAACLEEHRRGALELIVSGLLRRVSEGVVATLALTAVDLAAPLARALATPVRIGSASALVLAAPSLPATALLSVASLVHEAPVRARLLVEASARARRSGDRAAEMDALLLLAESEETRTPTVLLRLERLTRDAGVAAAYPKVVLWLEQAAAHDEALVPVARRRGAEKAAREGRHDEARSLADQACEAARRLGDAAEEARTLATVGAVALYRADVARAEEALRRARSGFAEVTEDDAEEHARLEHNLGVVAMYGGRHSEARQHLERSLRRKRILGDRAGVRACLLNLGLASSRTGHLEDAARFLDEALALALSLEQTAGRAWCLAARAEVALASADDGLAERLVGEAEALGEGVPAPVRADLALLRSEVHVARGEGSAASRALESLQAEVREHDALVDGRALVLQASVELLGGAPRSASRLAVRAARRARSASLPELEARALDLLRRARQGALSARAGDPRYAPRMDRDVASWLDLVARGAPRNEALSTLLGRALAQARGERAFAVTLADQALADVLGIDADGLPLAEPSLRVDALFAAKATTSEAPVHEACWRGPLGTGSRVAAASPPASGRATRLVLVLEHRFREGHFSREHDASLLSWATLGAVALRLEEDPGKSPKDTPPSSSRIQAEIPAPSPVLPPLHAASDETTVLPISPRRGLFPAIVGKSAALDKALSRLEAAARSSLPALIVGETGVGKELFARGLHDTGPRARGPFVALNCAAVPEALFEAELFGHGRGAFTGAEKARSGLLAAAEHGTLFLDEIGELPLGRQASLLRALETQRYRPVGTDEERRFDVRIVAATNRDLEVEVTRGAFRRDLFYRINVLLLRVPPLRERPEDIPLLVRSFLARAGLELPFDAEALSALRSYGWPGNVRELEHEVQRLASLGLTRVTRAHLGRKLRSRAPAEPLDRASEERREVERALAEHGSNITHAARALGLTRQGLKKRMIRLGLREPTQAPPEPALRPEETP